MTAKQSSRDPKKQDHKCCAFWLEWLTQKNFQGILVSLQAYKVWSSLGSVAMSTRSACGCCDRALHNVPLFEAPFRTEPASSHATPTVSGGSSEVRHMRGHGRQSVFIWSPGAAHGIVSAPTWARNALHGVVDRGGWWRSFHEHHVMAGKRVLSMGKKGKKRK